MLECSSQLHRHLQMYKKKMYNLLSINTGSKKSAKVMISNNNNIYKMNHKWISLKKAEAFMGNTD